MCRYCGMDVFYFSCNHGSKVFFESLGDDWPVHDCLSKLDKLDMLISKIGKQAVERAMASTMMRVGWRKANGLEEKYQRLVGQNSAQRQAKPQPNEILKKVPMTSRTFTGIGVVREIVILSDVWKAIGVRQGSMEAGSIANKLPSGPCAQLTIHVGDLGMDDIESYTMLCSQVVARTLSKRMLVEFVVTGVVPITSEGFWVVKTLSEVD